MKKKVYNISGFDCASCAAKAGKHISCHQDVEYAHLDFSNNKLYITFKDKAWSVEELAAIIKEVESDPLEISELDDKPVKSSLFNNKMKWQLIRVGLSTLITLVCIFALGKEQLSWLRFAIYASLMVVIGYDIFYKVFLHIKNRSNILDHNFLILIASIGSLVIAILGLSNGENYLLKINDNYNLAFDASMEAVLVMILFQIGSVIESYASNKSKLAITNAISLRADRANLLTENGVEVIKPEELKIGDNIIVVTGEMVPVDGMIYEGEASIDTSSLTGEFVPIESKINQEIYAGYMVRSGSIKMKVSKTYENSSISKIIDLISSSGEKKSRADRFVDRFSKWYTPVMVIVAILTFIIGASITKEWLTWTHTGLEVLVIGCPCAIVISVPLAYFSAIGLASKNGVVIKGANYLDELSHLGKVVTDKTGTLTEGSFKITKIYAVNGDKDELLNTLYICEALSNHPIAKAITHDIDISIYKDKPENYLEEAGLGITCIYQNHKLYAGNDKLLDKYNIQYEKENDNGTVIYVAKDNQYMGYVILSDEIKKESRLLMNYLSKANIKTILLTGDNENNAKYLSDELGIDKYYSSLLPEDKTRLLELEMKEEKKNVAFIGDGINDAPSIRRSDIGIAMGGIGSDVAVENADVVIMNDDPSKLISAIKVSKIARHTSIFNIAFALAIKALVMILAIIFPNWSYMMYIAVFADTGLTILLVINSLLLLKRKIK